MIVTVSVTKREITQGTQTSIDTCPVARAIKRLVKRSVNIHVVGGASGIDLFTVEKEVTRKLPMKAQNFIRRFDGGDAVEPFEFKLNIPDAFLKS